MVINADLRIKVADMIHRSGEGHIPSSYSIVDVINYLYEKFLNVRPSEPLWEGRDYFVLSKGHGAAGFFAVLHKHGFLSDQHIEKYSQKGGVLGGHPDCTKVPGAEASTGSLGHGFPFSIGISLGLKLQNKKNKVVVLVGDGESNEGTIWEAALVAAKQRLGNLCVIVDNNGSSAQILPIDPIEKKWEAFGWKVYTVDGHSNESIHGAFSKMSFELDGQPKVVIANTVKGKGVSFVEGHGPWHHKVPTDQELQKIIEELS
jgi:transketolase